MDSEGARPSSARSWWLLIGGIVVFLVVFDLIENLISPDPAISERADTVPSSAAPTLRRLDDGAIEIRHDLFRRSTIRMGNEDSEKALFDCLAQGMDQTFEDGTEGWTRARVRRETERIQDECLALPHPVHPPADRLDEHGQNHAGGD